MSDLRILHHNKKIKALLDNKYIDFNKNKCHRYPRPQANA